MIFTGDTKEGMVVIKMSTSFFHSTVLDVKGERLKVSLAASWVCH